MISAISVKDRLKNRAIATGKTMQETLTAYEIFFNFSVTKSILLRLTGVQKRR